MPKSRFEMMIHETILHPKFLVAFGPFGIFLAGIFAINAFYSFLVLLSYKQLFYGIVMLSLMAMWMYSVVDSLNKLEVVEKKASGG